MTFPRVTVRRVARILNGGTPPSGVAEFWGGEVSFVTPSDLNGLDGAPLESTARSITVDGVAHSGLAPAGSVLLSTRAPIGHIGRLASPAAFNQGCRALVPARNHEARFLAYALVAARADMDARGLGTTFLELSGASLAQVEVPLAPLEAQRAIADYLDRETAQIDAFIAKNEELIALLTERRAAAAQSEVEHHVGGGARLKFRLREIDVRAGSTGEKPPLLSVSIHHGVVPRQEGSESANESGDLSHYKVAKLGDIVLNRMRAFQGGLGVAPCEGLVSPDYAVLRPAESVDPAWLALVMRTPRFVGEIAMRLRGIGGTDSGAVRTPRISVADLGAILVSVPSAARQSAELQAVRASTERTEKALAVAQRSVELARERRGALISAAVMGEIDVGSARLTVSAGQLTAS